MAPMAGAGLRCGVKNMDSRSPSELPAPLERALPAFNALLVDALERSELVPELLGSGGNETRSTRLLCQTRAIYFLCEYARLCHAPGEVERAGRLFTHAERAFCTDGHWLHAVGAERPAGERLYGLAFLLLAVAALFSATGEREYLRRLEAIARSIAARYDSPAALGQPKDERPKPPGSFEQNSLMHYFEACLAATAMSRGAVDLRDTLSRLLKMVEERLFQAGPGLIAEEVAPDGSVVSYELGHSYEWSVLLSEYEDLVGRSSPISPAALLRAAEKIQQRSPAQDTVNALSASLQPLAVKTRIWAVLERVRALQLVQGSEAGVSSAGRLLSSCFDSRALPIEYPGADTGTGVKSTTGYHVINCFAAFRKGSAAPGR
jgi:mannose/cellobiose epimerase-like protein (N-acyl-D-glucosamine 2-epimerase family)